MSGQFPGQPQPQGMAQRQMPNQGQGGKGGSRQGQRPPPASAGDAPSAPRGQRRPERRRGNGNNGPERKNSDGHGERSSDRTEARAERTAVFGKTKLCKFFILGVCAKGNDCAFAHNACEMQASPDLSCTKICKTLINTGMCDDPECKYAHNKEELRHVPGVPMQLPKEIQSSGSASASSRAPGGGSGGQSARRDNPHAAPSGPPMNPMMGFMPGMLGAAPPGAAGNAMDPAQAMVLQQWMSSMAMHMTQMQMMAGAAAQSQEGQRTNTEGYRGLVGQPQGAASLSLSNALFSAGANPEAQFPQAGFDLGLAAFQGGDPRQVSGAAPQKRGVRNASSAKASYVACEACGCEYLTDAKFCRGCGQQRREEAHKPVSYKVKNTFIDVQTDGSSSPAIGGMRNVKSAAGRLYAQAGDSSPETSVKDGNSPAMASSFRSVPPFPGTDEGLTSASLAAMGAAMGSADDVLGRPSNFPLMPRGNTWASDLCALDEEAAEDPDDPDYSSEKRLQDMPYGGRGEGQASAEGQDSSRDREGSEGLGMEGMVIKNTFLEYKHKPMAGMRQVQTASGRLDLMGDQE